MRPSNEFDDSIEAGADFFLFLGRTLSNYFPVLFGGLYENFAAFFSIFISL